MSDELLKSYDVVALDRENKQLRADNALLRRQVEAWENVCMDVLPDRHQVAVRDAYQAKMQEPKP